LERALKFSKLNKSQGSGVVTINYWNVEEKYNNLPN
jgi:hypothetical protein